MRPIVGGTDQGAPWPSRCVSNVKNPPQTTLPNAMTGPTQMSRRTARTCRMARWVRAGRAFAVTPRDDATPAGVAQDVRGRQERDMAWLPGVGSGTPKNDFDV